MRAAGVFPTHYNPPYNGGGAGNPGWESVPELAYDSGAYAPPSGPPPEHGSAYAPPYEGKPPGYGVGVDAEQGAYDAGKDDKKDDPFADFEGQEHHESGRG